jgi:hypothetical protein
MRCARNFYAKRFICSPYHLFTLPFVHLTICLPYRLFTLEFVHLTIYSPYHLFTLPFVHPTIYSPYHLFTLPFVHPTICSPYHLFTLPFVHFTISHNEICRTTEKAEYNNSSARYKHEHVLKIENICLTFTLYVTSPIIMSDNGQCIW